MATKESLKQFLIDEFPQCDFEIDDVFPMGCQVRQPIDFKHLRPGNTVSGPTMMALADFALYVAVLGQIGIVPLTVTSQFSINFLRKPEAKKDIVAECHLLKVGRSLAVGEVKLFSEGQDAPIAHATGTYAIPPKSS